VSAPFNNRNARKPEGEARTAYLHIRCHAAELAAWHAAAARANASLATWVTASLRQAATQGPQPHQPGG